MVLQKLDLLNTKLKQTIILIDVNNDKDNTPKTPIHPQATVHPDLIDLDKPDMTDCFGDPLHHEHKTQLPSSSQTPPS